MPIDTRPVNTSTTATDTTEACPYCRTSDLTRQTADTGLVRAWACDNCGTDWAFTVPDSCTVALVGDLGAAVREAGRLRWLRRQIITLADTAPSLTDEQLRTGLLNLADRAVSR